MCHRRSSIYDVRCRTPLAVYPETGRAARNASCSTLLRARFTQPTRSRGPLVVSYTTVSPLPPASPNNRRSGGGLLSVALSRGLPRVGITHRPALWSPDVPRYPRGDNATVLPTHSKSQLSPARGYNPDSPVRTRIALLSGQSSTSSGAAARIAAMSNSLSSRPLASDTPPRSSDAPWP